MCHGAAYLSFLVRRHDLKLPEPFLIHGMGTHGSSQQRTKNSPECTVAMREGATIMRRHGPTGSLCHRANVTSQFDRCRRGKTMRVDTIPEIGSLSTAEKILLVEDLWDSIAADAAPLPVPQSHLDELERRWERSASSPGDLLSLEELKATVDARR